MSLRHAALVALLGLAVGACGADADPSSWRQANSGASSRTGGTPSPLTAIATASAAASARPTPKATPKPTLAPVPPKPTGATFRQETHCLDAGCNRAKFTQTVFWRTPRMKGVEIRVYGVTECLAVPAHPKPDTSGPCLVEHTAVPASIRRLLATAPATAGRVSWTWKQGTGCEDLGVSSPPNGPWYRAVVIAAYNGSGHSIFAIAEPGQWYQPPAGDTMC